MIVDAKSPNTKTPTPAPDSTSAKKPSTKKKYIGLQAHSKPAKAASLKAELQTMTSDINLEEASKYVVCDPEERKSIVAAEASAELKRGQL